MSTASCRTRFRLGGDLPQLLVGGVRGQPLGRHVVPLDRLHRPDQLGVDAVGVDGLADPPLGAFDVLVQDSDVAAQAGVGLHPSPRQEALGQGAISCSSSLAGGPGWQECLLVWETWTMEGATELAVLTTALTPAATMVAIGPVSIARTRLD
ncbi:hypothetical protein [Actinosynnema mirum]|uniref:hypothetical protein n=1 Tax=Actinosynnema mirum TaxID=40567 RepID=UPI00019AB261|nr:hypothetical protein [Actinosynnema mirum]